MRLWGELDEMNSSWLVEVMNADALNRTDKKQTAADKVKRIESLLAEEK